LYAVCGVCRMHVCTGQLRAKGVCYVFTALDKEHKAAKPFNLDPVYWTNQQHFALICNNMQQYYVNMRIRAYGRGSYVSPFGGRGCSTTDTDSHSRRNTSSTLGRYSPQTQSAWSVFEGKKYCVCRMISIGVQICFQRTASSATPSSSSSSSGLTEMLDGYRCVLTQLPMLNPQHVMLFFNH
jgi:hypothetical protein